MTETVVNNTSYSKGKYLIALFLFVISVAFLAGAYNLPTIDPQKTEDIRILFELANVIENTERPEDFPAEYPIIVSTHPQHFKTAYDRFGLQMGPFLIVNRQVQTYAWLEEKTPEKELPKDKSLKLIDKYRYKMEWLDNPKPYKELKVWKGHIYSMPNIQNKVFIGGPLYFGRLELNIQLAKVLQFENYKLTSNPKFVKAFPHDDYYIYTSDDASTNTFPGDHRLYYSVLRAPEKDASMTVFGARDFNRLVHYKMGNGKKILYLHHGSIEDMREQIGSPPIPVKVIKVLQILMPIVSGLLILAIFFVLIRKNAAKI